MFNNSDFDRYADIYSRLFESVYPAKNSTGFPERNLTVNFCQAQEQEATSLFEMQFGSNNREHMDGVILSDRIETNRTLGLIESKRYKSKSAVWSVGRDIGRIYRFYYELKRESLSPKTRRIDMSIVGKVIGCELADVWIENRFKMDVRDAYKQGFFLDKYKTEIYSGIIAGLQLPPKTSAQVASMVYDQVQGSVCYDVKDIMSPNWPENYTLVSFFWEIIDDKIIHDALFESFEVVNIEELELDETQLK